MDIVVAMYHGGFVRFDKIDKSYDGEILVVKNLNLNIAKGEFVTMLGPSGSGKTTIALSSLGYTKPGLEFAGGEVRLEGEDVITMESDQLRSLRGQRVAYLAQSAAAAFNPALTIGEQVTETCVLHGILTQEQAEQRGPGGRRARCSTTLEAGQGDDRLTPPARKVEANLCSVSLPSRPKSASTRRAHIPGGPQHMSG